MINIFRIFTSRCLPSPRTHSAKFRPKEQMLNWVKSRKILKTEKFYHHWNQRNSNIKIQNAIHAKTEKNPVFVFLQIKHHQELENFFAKILNNLDNPYTEWSLFNNASPKNKINILITNIVQELIQNKEVRGEFYEIAKTLCDDGAIKYTQYTSKKLKDYIQDCNFKECGFTRLQECLQKGTAKLVERSSPALNTPQLMETLV